MIILNIFEYVLSADHEKENRLTLNLLDAIEHKDDVSQRHMAQHMGVALGMANSYLKRCVKKGWIKVTTAPANRYLYYLTPTGFAEKARITGEFLSTSLALVRQSGEAYSLFFEQLTLTNSEQKSIVFVGLSDLTEMAYLRALKSELKVIGVYAPPVYIEGRPTEQLPEEWFGIPVLDQVSQLPPEWEHAVFVFTSLDSAYEVAELMRSQHASCELFIPEFLSLIPPQSNESHLNEAANQ